MTAGMGSHLVFNDLQDQNRGLLACYHHNIKAKGFQFDAEQEPIIHALQKLYEQLILSEHKVPPHGLERFISFVGEAFETSEAKTEIKSLYIWGGVGRGKTYLMNLFYKCLPIEKKLRLHFHRFMQIVHEELKTLKGVEDPLRQVAKHFAEKAHVICLDEVHVDDITDAMLLGRLLEHLFDLNVVLVSTSNFAPNQLYKNGLQREQFLPAISLLERYAQVIRLAGKTDYRLAMMQQSTLYQVASGELSEQRLEQQFEALAGIQLHRERKDVIINQRPIPVKMWSDGIAWFRFDALCTGFRSTDDYLQIGRYFHTVFISDIPIMSINKDDSARRFINMIDAFYDLHVNIVVSAAAAPEKLYTSGRLAFEFKRTASRLREMQSKAYLAERYI